MKFALEYIPYTKATTKPCNTLIPCPVHLQGMQQMPNVRALPRPHDLGNSEAKLCRRASDLVNNATHAPLNRLLLLWHGLVHRACSYGNFLLSGFLYPEVEATVTSAKHCGQPNAEPSVLFKLMANPTKPPQHLETQQPQSIHTGLQLKDWEVSFLKANPNLNPLNIPKPRKGHPSRPEGLPVQGVEPPGSLAALSSEGVIGMRGHKFAGTEGKGLWGRLAGLKA